ncbi:MAG TPA: GNAT family protein [Thermomicrobiales bacterium]|nr:GNAT family protein [Thermomicrobiales bacterium]
MSPRIALRRASVDDVAFLHALRAEPSVRAHQPIAQRPPEELRATIEDRAADALDATFTGKAQWVILADNAPAGWIALDVTSREHGIASIGYSLAPAFRGRGIASGALRQVVALAFDPAGLALHRLEANVAVANVASQRVLQAAGFAREGIARGLLRIDGAWVDHERYGLLNTDITQEQA